MRNYEMVVVYKPDLGDENMPATIEKLSKVIADRGGTVTKNDHWGRRRLAYPIRRSREGNVVLWQFSLDPSHVKDIDASLKLSEEVLRHLIVTVEA